MSSSLEGLPYAMQRTPVSGSGDTDDLRFVHGFDEELKIFERSRRQHSVPEVEDVARPSAGTPEHVAGALAHALRSAQPHRGVQVALDAAVVAHPLPRPIPPHAPVD